MKRQGGILKLAIGNSKVASDEQIYISTYGKYAKLTENRGKLYIYNILGLTCKAFSEIKDITDKDGFVRIYVEFGNSIELYLK